MNQDESFPMPTLTGKYNASFATSQAISTTINA